MDFEGFLGSESEIAGGAEKVGGLRRREGVVAAAIVGGMRECAVDWELVQYLELWVVIMCSTKLWPSTKISLQ